MAFSGDLEHLSVMDVVQMMHQGRKSGTLTFRGRRGECRLVFRDGSIVSANHGDNRMFIGRILVEAGAISEETLQSALRTQDQAGASRRPLVATLIEGGLLDKEAAHRGLQSLIQLAIVDVLTWKGGTFSLDPEVSAIADEFSYFPERLHEGIQFNAEYLLMDALRIYDERKNAGALEDESPGPSGDDAGALTADDLGLGNLDALERKIPGVYLGLPERPASPHADRLRQLVTGLIEADRTAVAAFLDALPARKPPERKVAVHLVYCGADSLMAYCLDAVCRREGISVLATDEPEDLGPVIERFLQRRGATVLTLDVLAGPDPADPSGAARLRGELRRRFPHLDVIQLVPPGVLPLASGDGAVTCMARPPVGPRAPVDQTIGFLREFPAGVLNHVRGSGGWLAASLAESLDSLRNLTEPAEVALFLLRLVAETFPRAVTLVVRGEELVGERGIGLGTAPSREPSQVPDVRIPLAASSPLRDIIDAGRAHFGDLDAPALRDGLFSRVGAPQHGRALLLPLRVFGKTISLTYGDFGPGEAQEANLAAWHTLSVLAGLILEDALWRTKPGRSASPPPSGAPTQR